MAFIFVGWESDSDISMQQFWMIEEHTVKFYLIGYSDYKRIIHILISQNMPYASANAWQAAHIQEPKSAIQSKPIKA